MEPLEGDGESDPGVGPLEAWGVVMLCLAAEALEVNGGRLDEREALRRAGVFLGLSLPRSPSPPE